MNFYTFENREMPWGDYGNILYTGFAYEDSNDPSLVYIERVGPYVPPVYSCSQYLLVSEKFAKRLEQSDLKGFTLRETRYKKVVKIDWEKWDFDEEPEKYPRGGEPENYILAGRHNPKLMEVMEKILCFQLDSETLTGRKSRVVSGRDELFIIENSWTGNDIFLTKGAGYIFFSEKAKQWFEEHADGYVQFERFNSKVATADEINFAIEYITPPKRKADPYAHLSIKDWKNYQKYVSKADLLIIKVRSNCTEKEKKANIEKAIEFYRKAEQIRPLGKKEQKKMQSLINDFVFPQ
jgi:hypothetical protein